MLAGYQPESELSSNKLQIFMAILEVSSEATFYELRRLVPVFELH
jgi:hypothetical protein